MKPHNRKMLLLEDDATQTAHEPHSAYSPASLVRHHNASSTLKPSTPFDSSMALTVLVLLAALFFMGFFSVYIRRIADDSSVDLSRRRRHQRPSSFLSPSRTASCKGLDPSAVGSLPLFPYGGDAKDPIECPVCLGEFQEKETIKIIPYCRHVFHPRCIDTWLSSHVSCPLCRTAQLFPAKADGGGDEVSLSVSGLQGRSAAQNDDTRIAGRRDVGSVGMRRTSSQSSIGERVPSLHRTSSF